VYVIYIKKMLSLQNFTKNSSHGWGDLFVSVYLNQMIELAQSVWVMLGTPLNKV